MINDVIEVIHRIEAGDLPRSAIDPYLRPDGKLELTHAQIQAIYDMDRDLPLTPEFVEIPENSIEVIAIKETR